MFFETKSPTAITRSSKPKIKMNSNDRKEQEKLVDVENMVKRYVSYFPGIQIFPTPDLVAYALASAGSSNYLNHSIVPTNPAASRSSLVLVDVRDEAEMEVSVIPRSVSKAYFERNMMDNIDEDTVIVAYCTVGEIILILYLFLLIHCVLHEMFA